MKNFFFLCFGVLFGVVALATLARVPKQTPVQAYQPDQPVFYDITIRQASRATVLWNGCTIMEESQTAMSGYVEAFCEGPRTVAVSEPDIAGSIAPSLYLRINDGSHPNCRLISRSMKATERIGFMFVDCGETQWPGVGKGEE